MFLRRGRAARTGRLTCRMTEPLAAAVVGARASGRELGLQSMIDDRRIDARSLAFGRAIAARLAEHPGIIGRARATAARWLETGSPRANPDVRAWLAALGGPVEGVVELLTSPDERAVRMRQSNPFAGVLSAPERTEILKRFQTHDAPLDADTT
jgi:hypothetical protein